MYTRFGRAACATLILLASGCVVDTHGPAQDDGGGDGEVAEAGMFDVLGPGPVEVGSDVRPRDSQVADVQRPDAQRSDAQRPDAAPQDARPADGSPTDGPEIDAQCDCGPNNDADQDGVRDDVDNCPTEGNAQQADTDGDGVGDACDGCPSVSDPDQGDADEDGYGDACDPCPDTPAANTDHDDLDGDGEAECAGDCDDANPARSSGGAEICDLEDNNCNGIIDEGFPEVGRACTVGIGVCETAGRLACAVGNQAPVCMTEGRVPVGAREVCDSQDNDCDGSVDEDVVRCCEPGTIEACGSAEGQCQMGTRTCDAQRAWSDCDDTGPVDEICNGLDDDCDGQPDEALASFVCGLGQCARELMPACIEGELPECDPLEGAGEEGACDDVDNDCDGQTDENFDLGIDNANCGVCGRECEAGVECENGACGGIYRFEGIRQNVPDVDIVGWRQCHTGDYASQTPLADILDNCDGRLIMYGCREAVQPDWSLLAMGERDAVFMDTGDRNNVVHEHNGVAWYFSQSYSIGFVPVGEDASRNSCDTGQQRPELRMCWHTSNQTLSSGYRCGNTTLNGNARWERSIWTAD